MSTSHLTRGLSSLVVLAFGLALAPAATAVEANPFRVVGTIKSDQAVSQTIALCASECLFDSAAGPVLGKTPAGGELPAGSYHQASTTSAGAFEFSNVNENSYRIAVKYSSSKFARTGYLRSNYNSTYTVVDDWALATTYPLDFYTQFTSMTPREPVRVTGSFPQATNFTSARSISFCKLDCYGPSPTAGTQVGYNKSGERLSHDVLANGGAEVYSTTMDANGGFKINDGGVGLNPNSYKAVVTMTTSYGAKVYRYLVRQEDGTFKLTPNFSGGTYFPLLESKSVGPLQVVDLVKQNRTFTRMSSRTTLKYGWYGAERVQLAPEGAAKTVYLQILKNGQWVNYQRQTTLSTGIFDFGAPTAAQRTKLKHFQYNVTKPSKMVTYRVTVPTAVKYNALNSPSWSIGVASR